MRERWTDERLDDLKGSVDAGFKSVDVRFDKVDRRFDRFETKVDERFDRLEEKLDRRFGLMEQRFDTVMHSFVYGVIALTSAMLTGFVALAIAAL